MAQLVAFLGVSAIVIMTPGQDTALTIRSSLGEQSKRLNADMVILSAGLVYKVF